MRWEKKGRVYAPDGASAWARHSALQPTPILRGDVIRIFVGLRDDEGVSRIGWVDVDAAYPSKVLAVSQEPSLDIGLPGAFDENGVVPCAVVARDGKLFLYYAGYQLGHKVRFFVFGGLATSADGGDTFVRHADVPVMDRTDDELYFRVIHSILYEDGVWKTWYGGGSSYVDGNGRTLPVYDIRYLESRDGIRFNAAGTVCVSMNDPDEHRLGRPYVLRDPGVYRMFYAVGTKSKGYRLGYAESPDGLSWNRKDGEVGIDVSEHGWDSQMISYPAVVRYGNTTYLFYNGNDYGRDGFGYAVLREP